MNQETQCDPTGIVVLMPQSCVQEFQSLGLRFSTVSVPVWFWADELGGSESAQALKKIPARKFRVSGLRASGL